MRGRGMVNDRGRVSLTNTSAADLKFLHRLRQTHFRNFKSKSGTRIICLLVPLLLPKFVSEGAAMYHELRKRGTSAADLKFLYRLRQTHFRNFKSTALGRPLRRRSQPVRRAE